MKSNCLIYALQKWHREGGYLVIRKSRFGWWPHFLHMDRYGQITHYSPKYKYNRWFPPFLFKGRVKKGDKE